MSVVEDRRLMSQFGIESNVSGILVPKDPDVLAKEQVAGIVNRFHAFEDGRQDNFFALFVSGFEHHVRQHRCFAEELGIDAEIENRVFSIGSVALDRQVEYDAENATFGVSYTGTRS